MPCHGLCLARVHISEHDVLLYLFIFLFRELSHFPFLWTCPRSSLFCCYLHTWCHCTHQLCPVLGKAIGWYLIRTFTHACVHVSELFRARGHCGHNVYTRSLSCVCTLSLILFFSGFRGAPTGLQSDPLPGSAPGCSRMGTTPIVIMLGISFPDWIVMERKASDY